jgi:hypothetical protein
MPLAHRCFSCAGGNGFDVEVSSGSSSLLSANNLLGPKRIPDVRAKVIGTL